MLIALAGDSTVTDHEGWGRGFRRRLATGVGCTNHARGGRSSKSYRAEGHWQPVLDTGADLVLIQFGHNDEPGKGPERETDPDTSFAANLAGYVAEARAAGLAPVLVTSLTRRQFTPDGQLHDTLGGYVAATRRVAAEQSVPLVDLHAASSDLCAALGPAGCGPLSIRRSDGSLDATHLNPAGGDRLDSLLAELLAADLPALLPYLVPATCTSPAE